MMIQDKEMLRNGVRDAMRKSGALDVWTNLSASFELDEAARGVEALIADQAELHDLARAAGVPLPEERDVRCDVLFQALFVEQMPLSDAAQRTLLTLERLGMPLGMRDLDTLREQLREISSEERIARVLDLAKLRGIACTLDPFAPNAAEELERIQASPHADRFLPTLTVMTLQQALAQDTPISALGCAIERDRHGAHVGRIAEVLIQWATVTGARMVRAGWRTADTEQEMLMRYAVLPLCEETRLPLAMALPSDPKEAEALLAWVEEMLQRSPALRFVLAAEDEQSAARLLRWKGRNARVFTVLAVPHCKAKEALAAMGTLAVPYASGARVLEQTIGGWVEARREIAQALYERYLPLIKMGWGVHQAEIETDAAQILGGNWEKFCKTGGI